VLNRFVQVAMLLGLMLLAFSAQAATQCSTISLAPDTLPSGTAGTAYGPVTFTASGSAATPFGYQTNVIVYQMGGYRYMDFVRVGLPLNLITFAVAIIAITIFFPF